jgi:hypothetical protein
MKDKKGENVKDEGRKGEEKEGRRKKIKKGERKWGKGKKMGKGEEKGSLNAKYGRIKAKRPKWESKNDVSQEGEKYHFQKGGGINIVFGPKYRPLLFYVWYSFIPTSVFTTA